MTDFVCFRCGRHAQTEQTLRRHDRYCRSKPVPQVSRRKSCHSCAKAKVRCVLEVGGCARCKARKASCELSGLGQGSTESERSLPEAFAPDPIDANLENAFSGSDVFRDFFGDSAFGGQDDTYSGLPVVDGLIPDTFNMFSSMETEPPLDIRADNNCSQSEMPDPEPYGQQFPGLFQPREQPPPDEQRVAMALGMIMSYPDLMKQRKTFPPFIHPQGNGTAANDWDLPSSLANAMSIAQMFYSRSNETRDFIWQTIRHEQQSIEHQYTNMPREELLAAAQTMTMYILMRLAFAPKEEHRFDEDLLSTCNRVFTRFKEFGSMVRTEELNGIRIPWKDWKYYEALRRTVSVFRVIFLLFDIRIDLPCPILPGFATIPLPANKLLWRAETEEDWEREWENEAKDALIHMAKANGEFLKLKRGYTLEYGISVARSKYYAGADELGILVLLSSQFRDFPRENTAWYPSMFGTA